MAQNALSDYDKVIQELFFRKYNEAADPEITELPFTTDEIISVAKEMGIVIKNVPDITYTYRSRRELPEKILAICNWILQPKGKSRFAFVRTARSPFIEIQEGLAPVEILNSLPEIVEKYTVFDEQGILSSIRYNRLVDIFTEITCFHLQSHVRTTIDEEGQIEIDDIYVGIDQEGNEYVLPFEAKSSDERDKLGWVQVANMVKYAKQNYPTLTCRPICAKPIDKNTIILIEFQPISDYEEIGITNIKKYKLVRPRKEVQSQLE